MVNFKNDRLIKLFLLKNDNDFDIFLVEYFSRIMPKERLLRYKKFQKYEDKLNCVLGYFLLFYALKKNNITNAPPRFRYGRYEKPRLNFTKNLYFSLSHTKNLIALSISKINSGIDVERIKPINRNILGRALCEKELEIFNKTKEKEKLFFSIWTRKEAFCKMKGESIFKSLLKINSLSLLNTKTFFYHNSAVSICSSKKFKLKVYKVKPELIKNIIY